MSLKTVAFIPARSGSTRIPNKNIRLLDGVPLLAYSINAALDSKIFDSVICATDSEEYADIAVQYGADVPFLRPSKISGSEDPDISWVKFMLETLRTHNKTYDIFAILRPTSPFRQASTIIRAYNKFTSAKKVDSIRAVQPCSEHPGKMWVLNNDNMQPLLPYDIKGVPWHSNQKSALPEIFIQNASLEMAWAEVVTDKKSISGSVILPFITDDFEGFDINEESDWILAEHHIKEGNVKLPKCKKIIGD